jgi:hypothetical protein
VSGLIEVPALVEALTLNKADFVKTGPRGAIFAAHRKALQQVVSAQLEEWGDAPQASSAPPRKTRALERDLESVIAGLADQYPILATLVERRKGGQRKLPLGEEGTNAGTLVAAEAAAGGESDGSADGRESQPPPGAPPAGDEARDAHVDPPGSRGKPTPARLGLAVRFESRPDDPELATLRESTIWVNDAHPACRRAVASRSEGYHIAVAVAMTLARLAVEAPEAHAFITTFLSAWGERG